MNRKEQIGWDIAYIEFLSGKKRSLLTYNSLSSCAGAEAPHESWMKQKLDDGWVYGTVKDADAKTHPCLVDFGELPVSQQAKDYIFRAVIHAMNGVINA